MLFRYYSIMKQYLAILMLLLLPMVAAGQTKKSEPLFEQAVEKSIVGQYEAAIDHCFFHQTTRQT